MRFIRLKSRLIRRIGFGLGSALILVIPLLAIGERGPDMPELLPLADQIEVRESWLVKRHEMLLPMMRRQRIPMWIIVNEEFHDDPLTEFIAPPRPYVGNRDLFIFLDAGEVGLKKLAIPGYREESLERFFEVPDDGWANLSAWLQTYPPATIALGIGGRRGMTRSLTHDSCRFLAEKLGPEAEKKFISAAPLIEEYLDTRIPEEFDHYSRLVTITENLGKRALSSEVITPGKTRVGDVRRWLFSQSHRLGLRTWFQPDLRIQRPGSASAQMRGGFLAVAREAEVFQRGDLVHLDFGLVYMGLYSDWQKMMVILRRRETEPAAGLQRALRNTNTLQDALIRFSRPEKDAAVVSRETMAEMERLGIEAQIYSHPLGNHGHALGASLRTPRGDRPTAAPDSPLRLGSYLAMELNTQTGVAEWGGQKVVMMAEDPVYLTPDGWKFFRPRQEKLYIIK